MKSAMRKMVILFLAAAAWCGWGASVQPELQTGGQTWYRLDNDLVTLWVNPSEGGRGVRLISKGCSDNLMAAPSFEEASGGTGFFCDRIIDARGKVTRDYEKSVYKVVSYHGDAGQATLKLICDRSPVTIEKEFILKASSTEIQVRYGLSNPGKANFIGKFWSCSAVPTGADGTVRLMMPPGRPRTDLTEKLRREGVVYSARKPVQGNYFLSAPERDYTAAVIENRTLVLTAPYEYLNEFYSYQPSLTGQRALVPTVEFFLNQFMVQPLAKGRAEAIHHPEMADPLADYVYRFSILLDVKDSAQFRYSDYRKSPLARKSTRFQPVLSEARAYEDYSTPAIPFLMRMARPLRMLTMCTQCSSDEMLELGRRVRLNQSIVEVSNPHVMSVSVYESWMAPEPMEAMRHALTRDFDVMLFSQIFQKPMPKDVVEGIRRKVMSGTPLIYVGTTNQFPSVVGTGEPVPLPDDLVNDPVLAELPVRPVVTAEKVGRGMVFYVKEPLQFNFLYWTQSTAILPMNLGKALPAEIPEKDYYFAWYGRLLRYASGVRPSLQVADSRWDDSSWQGKITAAGEGGAQVRLLVNGREKARQKCVLKAGETALAMKIPAETFQKNGAYFCTVLVETDKDCNFLNQVRRVQHPAGIVRLDPEKYCHESGEAVKGRVEIRGKGMLTLELRDSAGRLLCRQTEIASDGVRNFVLRPRATLMVPLTDLTALMKSPEGKILDRRQMTVLFRIPAKDRRLNFILWSHGMDSSSTELMDRGLADMGFNTVTGITTHILSKDMMKRVVESNLRLNMRFAPMTMHRISLWKVDSIVRKPCLRDPDYRNKIRSDVARTVAMAAPYGAELYYSGDENSLGHYSADHDMCHSPHCLAAFRKAMEKKYGSLEKLNRIWKTRYAGWKDVTPPIFAEARKSGNFIPWYEHRLFMMGAVSGALKQVKEELSAAAPGARLGISGQLITTVTGAFNWVDALPALDNPTAYIRETDALPDLIRSFGHPGMSAGAWIGYGNPDHEIQWNYWNQIVNGMFSPSFWYYAYFLRRGDRRLTDFGLFVKKIISDIRNCGAEQMFAQAEAVQSPVAVFYSIPSLVMSQVTGLKSRLTGWNYTENAGGWCGLLRDLGFLPPQIITHGSLAELDPAKTRMLVLPMAQVLSDQELRDLGRYVEKGGILIADVMPGRFNQFGEERTDGVPGELFGVKMTAPASSEAPGVLMLDGQEVSGALSGGLASPAGGVALGEIRRITRAVDFGGLMIGNSGNSLSSAAVLHRRGAGRSAYLNFLLYNYADIRMRTNLSLPLIQKMKVLVNRLEYPVESLHDVVPGTTVAEYRAHGNRYFGTTLFGNGKKPLPEKLVFGQAGHLYDTRAHRYLGFRRRHTAMLKPSDASMLALLPRKLEGLKTSLQMKDGRFLIRTVVSPAKVATIVRLQVWADGSPVKVMEQFDHVSGEKVFVVDPGLDPIQKNWRFKVTDLCSGVAAEQNMSMNEKGEIRR